MTEPEENPPPRVKPRVISAPQARQVYFCDFPVDAQLPEFWKRRPVVILSKKATLYSVVTVVPLSTKAQPDNPLAHSFPSVLRGEDLSWAICSHLTTVAVSRLVPPSRKIPKVSPEDFTTILRLALSTLPKLQAGKD